MPKDVTVSGGGEVTLADDPQHGKVLNIKHAGGSYPSFVYTVDVNKARGGTLKFSVAAKCPGEIPVIADKPWAKVKLILIAKDKAGKDQYASANVVGGKPDWANLNSEFKVNDDIVSIQICLRVELVVAEVFFDALKIELEAGNPKAAGPTVAGATPAKPVDNTPVGRTPKKTFEDGGMIFNPEIAGGLKKGVKPGATPSTILLVGPGLPFKEMDNFKPIAKWQVMPNSKELIGPAAMPSRLLASLPSFLGKNKPEVVVFFSETAGTRKPNADERLDWEDLARICKRMGAIPVFAVQAQGSQEELRKDMMEGVTAALAPAIELRAPSTVPKRLSNLLDLFDRHIFERTPVDAPVVGVSKGPDEE